MLYFNTDKIILYGEFWILIFLTLYMLLISSGVFFPYYNFSVCLFKKTIKGIWNEWKNFAVLNLFQNLLLHSARIHPGVFLFISTEQGAKIRTHPSSKIKDGDKHHWRKFSPGDCAIFDGFCVTPTLSTQRNCGSHHPENPAQWLWDRGCPQRGLHAPHENSTVCNVP